MSADETHPRSASARPARTSLPVSLLSFVKELPCMPEVPEDSAITLPSVTALRMIIKRVLARCCQSDVFLAFLCVPFVSFVVMFPF